MYQSRGVGAKTAREILSISPLLSRLWCIFFGYLFLFGNNEGGFGGVFGVKWGFAGGHIIGFGNNG